LPGGLGEGEFRDGDESDGGELELGGKGTSDFGYELGLTQFTILTLMKSDAFLSL